MSASEKDTEGGSATEKLTVVLETADLSATSGVFTAGSEALTPNRCSGRGKHRRMPMKSQCSP